MSKCELRNVKYEDIQAIIDMYAPYVTDTTVTSEYDVPSYDEFKKRIDKYGENLPWIVATIDTKLVGYGYAKPHRSRASYQWSVETSIYTHKDFQRRHIAKAIYSALFEILNMQGYYNIYVGITTPNEKSIQFHNAMGFDFQGRYVNSMYKFGEWRDVTWMGKHIREWDLEPKKTIDIHDICDTREYQEILERNSQIIDCK